MKRTIFVLLLFFILPFTAKAAVFYSNGDVNSAGILNNSTFCSGKGSSSNTQFAFGTYPDTTYNIYQRAVPTSCSLYNSTDLEGLLSGYPYTEGDFYWLMTFGGDDYVQLVHRDSSGVWYPGSVPVANTTSIQITNPTQATSTPSTTFDIDVSYTIGTDLASFSLDGSLPADIGLQIQMIDNSGNTIDLGTDYTIATSTGTHTYATTTTQTQGNYSIIASLIGNYGFTPPAPDCRVILPFVTCEGSGNLSQLVNSIVPNVSIANGDISYLGFNPGISGDRNGLATTTCSIVALGGCVQNAVAFLFYPSPGVLDQFGFLWSLIEKKPPFGYVYQTLTALRTLNDDESPAFSFGNIPLVDTIFTPFKNGLAALLWIGFFIAWYRGRLRHLDI